MSPSSTSPPIRSRMPDCVVTSSAVVGSSAISSAGCSAMACAIITRWRWPPDNSCGKRSSPYRAAGIPTRSSLAAAISRASERLVPAWITSVSATCAPIVRTGFSAVIGSWKIIAMRRPRIPHIAASSSANRSSPSSRAAPPRCAPSGSSPITASAVIDLPEPDSPATPKICPGAIDRLTSRTASMPPMRTDRLSMARRGGLIAASATLDRDDRAARHPSGSAPERWR